MVGPAIETVRRWRVRAPASGALFIEQISDARSSSRAVPLPDERTALLVSMAWLAPAPFRRIPSAALVAAALFISAAPLTAQTTGSIRGQVLDDQTGQPIVGAEVRIEGTARLHTLTNPEGRFLLGAVPAGDHDLVIDRIGYARMTVRNVPVRIGRASEVPVRLTPAAISVQAIEVQADRLRLIEPQVAESRSVIAGEELRSLPIDNTAQAIELATGVSDGHFRGGRIGQEVYVIDGIEVKNQLEASRQGLGLEFSPGALEEVEVVTGGFGAEYGSALSGVVSYVTRRGDSDRWSGRLTGATDHWVPESMLTGFVGLGASAGGPLAFLGSGAVLFVDVLAQGFLDADPRARGLTCLSEGDVPDPLAAEIRRLSSGTGGSRLHCPYTSSMLPHQQGDKLIGFARFDRPLPGDAALTLTLLRNRNQHLLYTPDFKYNSEYQLGQRTLGSLGTAAVDWTRHGEGSAFHLTLRGAAMRLDRQLGALDLATLDDRGQVAGIGVAGYEFLGSDYVRSPIAEQLAEPQPVPGYVIPGGSTGSPFGPAAEGLFYTSGTPHIANWNRMDMAGGDLVADWTTLSGSQLRAGGSAKFYNVESYERVFSHLPASALQYAEFFPATTSGFVQGVLVTQEDVRLEAGLRVEAFRSGLSFRPDRDDFLAPVLETSWHTSFNPRLGVAMPVPGTDGRTAARFNYGMVSQPPDFRYFLDSSIGDSLRTDIQRQGNPNLSFERGASYEAAFSQLVTDNVGAQLTFYYKQLRNLATGAIGVTDAGRAVSSVSDRGSVRGLELTARARFDRFSLQAGWALQRAIGVSSGSDTDTLSNAGDARVEYPLAFDRRHAIDLAIVAGRGVGPEPSPWSGALTATVQSGYPIIRIAADSVSREAKAKYLPWTGLLGMRVTREFASVPGCGRCTFRVVADGRNLLGLDNIIGVRRESGVVGPRLEDVEKMAAMPPGFAPIPRESQRYSAQIDMDADGEISEAEFRRARFGAALDRYDPSIFFGEARQLRLGLEVQL